MTSTDLFALYGALGSVAAITTALLAAVALHPLRQADSLKAQRGNATRGDRMYTDTAKDAAQQLVESILLNLGAAVVNAAVFVSWGYLAFAKVGGAGWLLQAPFVAVVTAALALFVVAGAGMRKLHSLRS